MRLCYARQLLSRVYRKHSVAEGQKFCLQVQPCGKVVYLCAKQGGEPSPEQASIGSQRGRQCCHGRGGEAPGGWHSDGLGCCSVTIHTLTKRPNCANNILRLTQCYSVIPQEQKVGALRIVLLNEPKPL